MANLSFTRGGSLVPRGARAGLGGGMGGGAIQPQPPAPAPQVMPMAGGPADLAPGITQKPMPTEMIPGKPMLGGGLQPIPGGRPPSDWGGVTGGPQWGGMGQKPPGGSIGPPPGDAQALQALFGGGQPMGGQPSFGGFSGGLPGGGVSQQLQPPMGGTIQPINPPAPMFSNRRGGGNGLR